MKKLKYTNPIRRLIPLAIIFAILLSSCAEKPAMKIALSKGSGGPHYEAYSVWLKKIDPDINIVDLHGKTPLEAIEALKECSGLLLTGGPDVDPNRYGRAYDSARCEIDHKRDTLEFAILGKSREMKLPILAICRGEQLLNVYMGGTLIVDIPADFETTVIHRCDTPSACFHDVEVISGTLLREISGVTKELVNSNHHQAVSRLSDSFIVSARSSDGLIEAYEWFDKKTKPFLIAVQWHPERLEFSNPLSHKIGVRFLQSATDYHRRSEK